MNSSSELLRTYARSLFALPKQRLIVDALLKHAVLQMDDLTILLQSQPKDIRALLNPLRSARLLSTHSRANPTLPGTNNRLSSREYYYINFHHAIDAIKYKIAKLRKQVESRYQQDESTRHKEWRCPRCKAEYESLELFNNVGDEGFYCDRCGTTLVQNEQAAQSNKDRSSHEKIRRLNDQLKKFDDLILKIDRVDIPENDFATAWDRRKHVPRPQGSQRTETSQDQYFALSSQNPYNTAHARKGQELVDTKNLAVNLTTGDEEEREEAERKEKRKQELAWANQLPEWYSSAYNGNATTGNGNGTASNGLITAASDEDEDDRDEDEGDFEDVEVAAPPITGLKREHSVAFQEDSEENEDFEDAV